VLGGVVWLKGGEEGGRKIFEVVDYPVREAVTKFSGGEIYPLGGQVNNPLYKTPLPIITSTKISSRRNHTVMRTVTEVVAQLAAQEPDHIQEYHYLVPTSQGG
jgi:hypothetical protein